MNWMKIEISPRFYEVDSYNIVNNMYYLSWFEMGRFSIADKAGLITPRFMEENLAFLVLEAHIYYKKPVTFLDKIIIESVVSPPKASKLIFLHRIRIKKDNSISAEGKTIVVLTKKNKLLMKMPDWVEQRIMDYIKNVQGGFKE